MVSLLLAISLVSLAQGGVENNLITALAQIESSNNPKAIGDGGDSVGILQIQKAVILDVNKIYGTRYSPKDRLNPAKSKEICRKYLAYYGGLYQKKTGKSPTNEVYARLWNGGPNGYRYKSTELYWKRVKRHL